MSNQLIEKIIDINGETCPKLCFENPLLDINVAKALSKSFVKILKTSKENSNVNNNLRMYILENIRKYCTAEPDGHLPIDENVTATLNQVYSGQLKWKSDKNLTDKELEAFLIRKYKYLQIDSCKHPTTSPDISQALININDGGVGLEILANDILHLSTSKISNRNLINSIWNNENEGSTCEKLYNDISIKMKSEIEKTLLSFTYEVLTKEDTDIEYQLDCNEKLTCLIKSASVSATCFQMCSSVLNYLFVQTNFDAKIQNIIQVFVKLVKQHCTENVCSVLYPIHLNHVALILDFDLGELPDSLRSVYVKPALKLLESVKENSEHDLVMLLSHFPQWFDIYLSNETNLKMEMSL